MITALRSAEFWVTLALLIASAIFLVDALQLPGGAFDPLGPGAAPEMVSGILIPLCLIVLVRAFLRSGRKAGPEPEYMVDAPVPPAAATPRALLLFFLLLVAYILAFQYEAAHFILITCVFLFLAVIALRGWSMRSGVIAGAVALGLSVFLFFALTRFFVIRLPGAF